MRNFLTFSLVIVALLLGAGAVRANPLATWAEVGDAGQLPATAQATVGLGELCFITGTISSGTDADMYLIQITNPMTFSATTVGQPGTLFDTQLYLFDTLGRGIEANDNVTLTNLRSTLPAANPLSPTTPGLYLLAISAFNNDPVVPGGLRIFPEPVGGIGVVGPTGPGGGLLITGWNGTGNTTGTYQIELTGAGFAGGAIPEPGTLVLGSLGALLLAGYGWRRRLAA